VAIGLVVLVTGLFAALSPEYTGASLRSLGSRASWQTVWALIDGNTSTGAYHADRRDLAAAALPQGNPAVVPTWLVTLLFGILYLWLWWRPSDGVEPRRIYRFTALTMVVFFLWSRGWSPQWLAMLAPLLLLSFPLDRAVLYVVVLTFLNIIEWPVMLSRGLNQWLNLTILVRTVVFVLLGYELWRGVRRGKPEGRTG
jgi:hypothetical protein